MNLKTKTNKNITKKSVIRFLFIALFSICSCISLNTAYAGEKIQNTNSSIKHIVTFELKQVSFTLDLMTHIKNEANKTTFQIPTSKEFYDSIKVGDEITDDFRVGSFILKGNLGAWNVTVIKKEIIQ